MALNLRDSASILLSRKRLYCGSTNSRVRACSSRLRTTRSPFLNQRLIVTINVTMPTARMIPAGTKYLAYDSNIDELAAEIGGAFTLSLRPIANGATRVASAALY